MPTDATQTHRGVVHAVDDDRPFLRAMARSLRGNGHQVDCFERAQDLLETIDEQTPGCVITDLRMPGMDGLTLQRELKQRSVHLPIIFVTGHGDTSVAVAALKGGAVDFLEKPFSERQLLESVDQALARDARERQLQRERGLVRERFDHLTPRERQVFSLVVSDRSNKEIARELNISRRTVEHHREHLMLKMQASSQAELITMAVLCGIHELHVDTGA